MRLELLDTRCSWANTYQNRYIKRDLFKDISFPLQTIKNTSGETHQKRSIKRHQCSAESAHVSAGFGSCGYSLQIPKDIKRDTSKEIYQPTCTKRDLSESCTYSLQDTKRYQRRYIIYWRDVGSLATDMSHVSIHETWLIHHITDLMWVHSLQNLQNLVYKKSS